MAAQEGSMRFLGFCQEMGPLQASDSPGTVFNIVFIASYIS